MNSPWNASFGRGHTKLGNDIDLRPQQILDGLGPGELAVSCW